jgi:hypothetical protein
MDAIQPIDRRRPRIPQCETYTNNQCLTRINIKPRAKCKYINLMNNKIIELATREQSSISSTWTEYLTIQAGQDKRFLIASAGYDSLAEVQAYFNEERDEYEVPEEIDGCRVVGVEDGYVIGGPLLVNMDNSGLEFDDPYDKGIAEWLQENGWEKIIQTTDIQRLIIDQVIQLVDITPNLSAEK